MDYSSWLLLKHSCIGVYLIGLMIFNFYNMCRPRKWNVCVVGSHDLFEHPHINDLAYMPANKDGRFGFNLLVGGFFSPKRCAEAVPLDAWVSSDDVIPLCKAVLEAYRDLGTRGNRQRTRMMWLIDELVSDLFLSNQTCVHKWDDLIMTQSLLCFHKL